MDHLKELCELLQEANDVARKLDGATAVVRGTREYRAAVDYLIEQVKKANIHKDAWLNNR